jgi:hypothetical protein
MKRLNEQASSSDPVTARAAALITAMPPLDGALFRRRPLACEAPQHSRTLRLRGGVALALSLGTAVAGAATLQRAEWFRGIAAPWVASSPSPSPVSPAPRPSPSVGSGAPRASSPPLIPEAIEAVEPPPPAAGAPGSHRAMPVPARAARKESPRDMAAAEDESALMIDAVRALRHDHDPSRAKALAEDVLQRYPHGAQVEEAMAVATQAALEAGDLTEARRSAARYLEAFRTGRFADRARRVLALAPK